MRFLPFRMVLLAMLASGCSVFTSERACTLIGCNDGLAIRFDQQVPADVTVTIELPNGETQSQECRTASFCSAVFFAEVSASSVTVRLSTLGNPTQVIEADDLRYEERRPNGEGCEPVCLIADLHVKLRVG